MRFSVFPSRLTAIVTYLPSTSDWLLGCGIYVLYVGVTLAKSQLINARMYAHRCFSDAGCRAPLELYGGSSRCSGLLRVNVTGDPQFPDQSGYFTACHFGFSEEAKQVVCRQLGCGDL